LLIHLSLGQRLFMDTDYVPGSVLGLVCSRKVTEIKEIWRERENRVTHTHTQPHTRGEPGKGRLCIFLALKKSDKGS
jgi:hypothetical protein